MKYCPQCKTGFPERMDNCPTHGGFLSEIIDLRPGMMIRSTYRIVRKLGEGGMGAVYLADQTLMDEQRAIKFLSRQWSRDEAFTSRFRREVRTLRQIRHRNVIDSGDLELAEDESLFFSMEFVDGPNLRDFLEGAPRPFDVRLALELVRGIAEGLGAAHAKGMVHRDIKPENILMAGDPFGWVPKIADFGIVATKENSTSRTRTGASLLTWAYAAPEQWRGMKSAELDGRTDLYALGGLLFEMLTGETVFDAEGYEGWAEHHKNSAPRRPSLLRPELAQWRGLDALVLRLLAKDRDDRPRDVAEVLSLLDAVEQGAAPHRVTVREETQPEPHRPSKPAPPRPPVRIETEVETPEEEGKPDQRHSRKPTHWIWYPIAMILVLAGVAFATYILIDLQQPKPATVQPDQTLNAAPVTQTAPPAVPPAGNLSGTVMDMTGAAIPNAAIEVARPGKGFTRSTTTDENGKFVVEDVPNGYANVTAAATGFKGLEYAHVLVSGGQTRHIKLTMDIGSSSEQVVVNVKR